MHKVKAVAVAATLLAGLSGALSAHAVTLAVPSSTSLGASYTSLGIFQFDYTFEIASSAYAALSGSSTGYNFAIPSLSINGLLFGIEDFAVSLDAVSIPVSSASGLPVIGNLGGYGTITTPTVSSFALSPKVITAGTHVVSITGKVVGSNGGSYAAELSLTPVAAPIPEPETYAMMLAGLGALGFLASRRRG